MQIHSDKALGIHHAARIARVDVVKCQIKGSRTRKRKWEVNLEGESRRAPNQRQRTGGKAATWDQWGVFLAVLFDADPDMVIGSSEKNAYYNGRDDFHHKTNDRFRLWETEHGNLTYWPDDAHGDHTFKYDPERQVSACTKCSAIDVRWS